MLLCALTLGCQLDPDPPTLLEAPLTSKAVAGSKATMTVPSVAKPPPKGSVNGLEAAITTAADPAIIEPDTDGAAYVAIDGEGVARFDGTKFALVLAAKDIVVVAAGLNGSVVVGSERGIATYDHETGTTTPHGSPGFAPSTVAVSGSGTLYAFGPGGGAFKPPAKGWVKFDTTPAPFLSSRSLTVGADGVVWSASPSASGRYDPGLKRWTNLNGAFNWTLVGGRRMWHRDPKRGRVLKADGRWRTTNKVPPGSHMAAAIWSAVGADGEVHLGGPKGVSRVNVNVNTDVGADVDGLVTTFTHGVDYALTVGGMDADGRGRTWMVGTEGLLVLPATGSQYGVWDLTSTESKPAMRSVYVQGNGPASLPTIR